MTICVVWNDPQLIEILTDSYWELKGLGSQDLDRVLHNWLQDSELEAKVADIFNAMDKHLNNQ